MTEDIGVSGDDLLVGSLVSLQNQYDSESGFLSTCGSAGTTAIFRNWPVSQLVFTTSTPYRGGAGLWRITSDTKRDGDPLLFGDLIHLRNCAPGEAFLDTCGYSCYVSELRGLGENIVVFASNSSNRFKGSGTWTVMSPAGKADGTPVSSGDTIHLMNMFPNGGYLDVAGYTKDTASFAGYDANLMVFTSFLPNRDGGSGTWRIRAEEKRMLMLMRGALQARTATPTPLPAHAFTLSIMTEPMSAGVIVQGRDFELALQTDGSLKFSIFGRPGIDGKAIYATSAPTRLLTSGQCHLVTCVCPETGDPVVFLDGQPVAITVATSRSRIATASDALLFLGSPDGTSDKYTGGLMNLGIWSCVLSPSDARLAGAGFFDRVEEGLVGFWSLSTSLKDRSPAANAFSPSGTTEFHFVACDDCVEVGSDFGAAFLKIEGPLPIPDTGNPTCEQEVFVAEGCPALLASIIDGSGEPRFPFGANLQIVDPNGTVYRQQEVNDARVLARIVPQDRPGDSLFLLCVNDPTPGVWKVRISTGRNLYFLFMFQALPYSHMNWALMQTNDAPLRESRYRSATTLSWLGGALVFSGLVVIAVTITVVTGGTAAAAGVFLASLALSAGTAEMALNPGPTSSLENTTKALAEKLGWTDSPIPPLSNGLLGGLSPRYALTEGPSYYGIRSTKRAIRARMIFVEFGDVTFSSLGITDASRKPDLAGIRARLTQGVAGIYSQQSYGSFSIGMDVDTQTVVLSGARSMYFPPLGDHPGGAFYDAVQEKVGAYWQWQDIVYIIAAGSPSKLTAWWTPRTLTMGGTKVYPVVFPNRAYFYDGTYTPPAKVFIHETGHVIGLPDLYNYDKTKNSLAVGSWDFMGSGRLASNFLGWHRHKLQWLGDSRKLYLGRQNIAGSWPRTYELAPLNGPSGVSLVVLCDTEDVHDSTDGYRETVNAPSLIPTTVIALEVAQPNEEYNPSGVLIYRVCGYRSSGEEPVEIMLPPGKTLEQAAWNEASGTFTASLFTVSVVRSNGTNWVVEITYTGV